MTNCVLELYMNELRYSRSDRQYNLDMPNYQAIKFDKMYKMICLACQFLPKHFLSEHLVCLLLRTWFLIGPQFFEHYIPSLHCYDVSHLVLKKTRENFQNLQLMSIYNWKLHILIELYFPYGCNSKNRVHTEMYTIP